MTTLIKHQDNQKLYLYGNFTLEELNEHKRDGWFYCGGDRIVKR